MDQPMELGWVLASWGLLAAWISWDVRRIRTRAHEEVRQLMDSSRSREERRAVGKRLVQDFDDYQDSRSRPLWWRWSHAMARPGNLIFGTLLGVALIFTAVWIDQGSVAEGLRHTAALCLAIALLTALAWLVRRVF